MEPPVTRKRGRSTKNSTSVNENETTDLATKQGIPLKKRRKRRSNRETTDSEDETGVVDECVYDHWKSSTPVLYDWLSNYELERPSSLCRWGPPGEFPRLFISEKAYKGVPNTLCLVDFDVPLPDTTPPEHNCRFEDLLLSPFVKISKTLVTPAKVTRIRTLPQKPEIVATHSYSHEVQVSIWNIDTQANCMAVKGAAASKPDLLLTGDDTNAQFALAMSKTNHVLSGGEDANVSLWSINDHISTLVVSGSTNSAGSNAVRPQKTFEGHTDAVKDLQFCPTSEQEFCSVGDDGRLLLWDARVGSDSTQEAKRNDALCCVDWNEHNVDCILTGSADSSVCVFDRRKFHDHVHKFEHKAPVLCVQWCPDKPSIFGSSGDDRFINIWDYGKADNATSGLVFKHCGHREKVVDFQWHANDPYTLVSLSHNIEKTGGGALQIWRISRKPWSLI